ncbi:MAG TPA: hypothetical protein VG274_01510 [Rhizomicrobium sp.]|nr:hypothetical protein [Rhizomicrobium sp.]
MNQLAPACKERVPKLQALFEFGQKQLAKNKAAIDKAKAEDEKDDAAAAGAAAAKTASPPAHK